MNARNKSAILIIGTLLVGIALGVLATNYVVNQRLDRMRDLRTRSGYSDALMDVIQPSSEAQRDMISEILEGTHEGMNELRREWSRGMRAQGDSMRSALREVLSPEQNARVDEWFSRYQRPRRSDGGRSRNGSDSDKDGKHKDGQSRDRK